MALSSVSERHCAGLPRPQQVLAGHGPRRASGLIRQCRSSVLLRRRCGAPVCPNRRSESPLRSGRPGTICVQASSAAAPEGDQPKSLPTKLRAWWQSAAKIDKKALASLGTSALLSYGWVSNVSYITCVLIATASVMKATGLSPLAPVEGQLAKFGVVYGGLFVLQNVIRPIRFGISVAVSPFFDKLVTFFQNRLGVARPFAFGICVFLVNVCGTIAYLVGGLLLVSSFLGVPMEFGRFGELFGAMKAAKETAVAAA
mmetsp:Transcript_3578/g.12846  ORF Transcript_3578/g.12846 Transcript_3578/m.12846 type:complete len:257 (+) Transcript_3578:95-865(+)